MRRWLHRLGPLLSLALFAAALWVLHRELGALDYRDLVAHLRRLGRGELGLALALTAAGYLTLTAYDVLGFRYAGRSLAYRRVAQTAFIGYAFSNSVGHALLTGTPIRYRLYSGWGVSAEEITRVVAFGFATFWLGFYSLAGVVFTVAPEALPAALHLPFATERPLGWLFLALVAAYLALAALRRQPLRLRGWEARMPGLPLALAQIAVSCLDWSLAAGVLYALLPAHPGLTYPGLLGCFLLAQIAGTLSQVPGGLGVFETVMVLLLAPWLPAAGVLAGLVAFRAVYYLLPLAAATLLLAGHEAARHRRRLGEAAEAASRRLAPAVPQALAFTTFVGGVLLLVSGATPPEISRREWLADLLPLPVVELSHFLGSVAGVGLLVLARGLQRRLRAAYRPAVALLAVGIAASLAKGLDWEEALALAAMLAALVACRGELDRGAPLARTRLPPGWVASIAAALLATGWLTWFSFHHAEAASEPWWRFAWSGDQPRSVRALVGAAVAAVAVGASRLLAPPPPEPAPPAAGDLDRAQRIAAAGPAYGYLALVGDKRLLFSDGGGALLMYAVEGRSWVAMGDPLGGGAEADELVWRFHEIAERHGGWTVFYQVAGERLDRYVELGASLVKLGEEARVPLAGFRLEASERKALRHAVHRAEREGCGFEVLAPAAVPAVLAELQAVSDAWLAAKSTREKGFSLGRFDPGYLRRLPVAAVRRDGAVVAFANLWPGGGAAPELAVDLMRYSPAAPAGVMDYLFARLMEWGAQEGFASFNLGMAPLAGLEGRGRSSLWNRLGTALWRHGEHFYNFQGLRRYKEKFRPEWEPRYLAAPGGLALPRVLGHLAALIAGGVGGVVGR